MLRNKRVPKARTLRTTSARVQRCSFGATKSLNSSVIKHDEFSKKILEEKNEILGELEPYSSKMKTIQIPAIGARKRSNANREIYEDESSRDVPGSRRTKKILNQRYPHAE